MTARTAAQLIRDIGPWAIPAVAFAAAMAFVCSASAYGLTDFPLDDAWIHRVYAQSFATGHGFAYNAGQQEAGATSPLWVVLTAPAHWLGALGTDVVVLTVKGIGTALGLLSLWCLGDITRRLTGSALAAALYAWEPRLLFSALSGMENTLLLFLALASTCAMLRGRWTAASLLIGLTTVTRPEALSTLGVFLVIVYLN